MLVENAVSARSLLCNEYRRLRKTMTVSTTPGLCDPHTAIELWSMVGERMSGCGENINVALTERHAIRSMYKELCE
jgi:hypothetical protein